jgi:CBS domain-containing protein
MLFLSDVLTVDPSEWGSTRIADVMRADAPVGRPDWTIGQALAAMLRGQVDHLPVVDDGGKLRGVCSAVDILDLDELLDWLETGGDGDAAGH